jgi:N-glycosylase/DNA lyase
MSCASLSHTHRLLNNTIGILCPLIEERMALRPTTCWSEADLRKELVGCVLGSQVRHEMAVAATENLEQAGLLKDRWWNHRDVEGFESGVLEVLCGRARRMPHRGSYRFPKSRSEQLALARDAIARTSLSERLIAGKDPKQLRQDLVADIPGLGPKQASMFLRNVGRTYDLAILDTHVLHFIRMQNLCAPDALRIATVRGYERTERILINYAESIGHRTGYLDWAIWITMKAAGELGLCPSSP